MCENIREPPSPGLGSTGNYFMGAREQANNFGDLGSLTKKQKKNNKRKNLHFV